MVTSLQPLQGKVALVTGASRGIGRSIALRLAAAGARIAINDMVFRDGTESLAAEVMAAGAPDVKTITASVTDAQQVQEMFRALESEWGGVDILVNNAGITRDSLLLRMSEEDWDAVLDVNLKGAFLCCRAAARSMIRKRWGRIINMSSVVALAGNPGQTNYGASKAGLIGITRTLAKELASRNITVNALAPGYIETDMVRALPEEKRAQILAMIPMARLGQPEDVAAVVAFLSSEEAGYITGQVIGVDGGIAV
ncbi:MAG: 3-oxoacyl-[acyl-carrier-protein] reductase [Chloroflexi bacterium]|nr:3-oxoacyl-[acyl-carrier-protein] reductase [Chloroflexota bacterium]